MPETKNYNFRTTEDNSMFEITSNWKEGNSRVCHSAIVDKLHKQITVIIVNTTGYYNKTRPFTDFKVVSVSDAITFAKRHCDNPLWYDSNAGRKRKER